MSKLTEIAPDVFKISTFISEVNMQFNQFLVKDKEPLPYHTGMKGLFPTIKDSSDKGIISWLGEYYLPCLPYQTNTIWKVDYFSNPALMNAFAAWPQLYADLYMVQKDRFHTKIKELISNILDKNDKVLHERSQKLHSIIGGRVSVLPPDTRHVPVPFNG